MIQISCFASISFSYLLLFFYKIFSLAFLPSFSSFPFSSPKTKPQLSRILKKKINLLFFVCKTKNNLILVFIVLFFLFKIFLLKISNPFDSCTSLESNLILSIKSIGLSRVKSSDSSGCYFFFFSYKNLITFSSLC